MAFQYGDAVRNAMNDAFETTVGASPLLRIYSGAPPATAGAAATGTLLAQATLPADFLSASTVSGGNADKTLLGTWSDTAADAAGTAGYFRIMNAAGTVTHLQGTVSMSGGGGDMILQNTSLAVGQAVTITAFTQRMGGG